MENVWLKTPAGSYISGSGFTSAVPTSLTNDNNNWVYQLWNGPNLVYQSSETYAADQLAMQGFGALLQAAGITGFTVVNLT